VSARRLGRAPQLVCLRPRRPALASGPTIAVRRRRSPSGPGVLGHTPPLATIPRPISRLRHLGGDPGPRDPGRETPGPLSGGQSRGLHRDHRRDPGRDLGGRLGRGTGRRPRRPTSPARAPARGRGAHCCRIAPDRRPGWAGRLDRAAIDRNHHRPRFLCPGRRAIAPSLRSLLFPPALADRGAATP